MDEDESAQLKQRQRFLAGMAATIAAGIASNPAVTVQPSADRAAIAHDAIGLALEILAQIGLEA